MDKWKFKFFVLIAFLVGLYAGYVLFAFDDIIYIGPSVDKPGSAYITILM